MFQEIQYIDLFASNCRGIEFPQYGKHQLFDVMLIFETSFEQKLKSI